MKKGKFAKRGHRGATNKTLALLLSLVLIVGCVAGGTLAWLLDTSDDVENTFTPSTINVDLTETTGDDYKMIPGWEIAKNPKATIAAGSEECYLFVKIVEDGGNAKVGNTTYGFDDFIEYTVDSTWTALDETSHPGVYYIKIDAANKMGIAYSILANDKVTVKGTVTKEMMDALATTSVANPVKLPTLTFTAYASQLYKNADKGEFSAEEAWANLNP